jgi:ABC-type branched-subunit amino acid transport system ATPase component
VLSVEDLSISFGGLDALRGLSLQVTELDRVLKTAP